MPLSVEFANQGFSVIGIESDKERIKNIEQGISYIGDVQTSDLKKLVYEKRFTVTSDYISLKNIDVIIICLPTPLTKTKEPDLLAVIDAVECIKNYAKNKLIILESTTYPGTTENVLLPILEKAGLKVGISFFLSFSPERLDPGNKEFKITNTPKIVGGVTEKCGDLTSILYSQIVKEVVKVSSPQVAEMVKIFENVFRAVNIALVNELTMLCEKMKISVWEVISAAESKPFGFMKFLPGPGLGGHCIPVDPFYLSWKAKEHNFRTKFIELAGEINESMPNYVLYRMRVLLNERNKAVKNSKVLILGVAYKKDISDTRESPSIKIIELLKKNYAKVLYNDPCIDKIIINGEIMRSVPINKKSLKSADIVVIATDHSSYNWEFIFKNSNLIFDTRNALFSYNDKKIIRL